MSVPHPAPSECYCVMRCGVVHDPRAVVVLASTWTSTLAVTPASALLCGDALRLVDSVKPLVPIDRMSTDRQLGVFIISAAFRREAALTAGEHKGNRT